MKNKILDDIEEIFDKNYAKFKGSNEAELMSKDDIADYILYHINVAFLAGKCSQIFNTIDDYLLFLKNEK